ncbi:MAG: DUF4180 domain-containing protein [Clostridia bacterium]|nr:DUF4180 domain-containing protein [Clostridia bacterium]
MKLHKYKHFIVAELNPDILINSFHDVMDYIATVNYNYPNQPSYFAFHKTNFPSAFFDLKTKFAGELLQKFVTYNIQIAIIGEIQTESKSLNDFIRECNRSKHINFHNHLEDYISKIHSWHKH